MDPTRPVVELPVEGRLPGLDGATGWLNSPPLTAAGLRGRVVLVGFWTYTCINWLRTLPYLRAWVYDHAPGVIARCPTCDQALVRLVRGPGRAWLDLRGLTYLQLPIPQEP